MTSFAGLGVKDLRRGGAIFRLIPPTSRSSRRVIPRSRPGTGGQTAQPAPGTWGYAPVRDGDLAVRLTYHHDSGEVDAQVSTAQGCAFYGVRGGT